MTDHVHDVAPALEGFLGKGAVPAAMSMPNFAYVGTSKAGSTWLFNALTRHPEVYQASSKGLYYFDQHFDEGPQWYLDHFQAADDEVAMGEISGSYLSSPQAAARIADINPDMRLWHGCASPSIEPSPTTWTW
jgi:hypothetical protein